MLTIYEKSQASELISLLQKRAANDNTDVMVTVAEILADIKKNGDAAVRAYCQRFDGHAPDNFFLSDNDIETSCMQVPDALKRTIERAAANIRSFHEKQIQQSRVQFEEGRVMGQRVVPLDRVGLYVPGGTAAYPSSVLMNAIPAKVAGVKDIVIATPMKNGVLNPAVVYAARTAGVTSIFTVGGAQAIAALAYGTESVKRVDKIVGPGNIYVATAKRLVFGTVDIDMFAGPSEVLVIADESADPSYIAADLMSQAEHDRMAAAILITTSRQLAEQICTAIEEQLASLSRNDIIRASLQSYGAAVIVDTLEEAVALSDAIAPEHLELAVSDPFALLGSVHNAGSIFLGSSTPEPLGDYFAGPNHVLPTNGTARFSSPLSVDSFIKKSSYLYYTPECLAESAADIIRFARAEGLNAHANSIIRRCGNRE